MPDNRSLLIEIGCEEIPARLLAPLAQSLAAQIGERLTAGALVAEGTAAATAHWTPRRLIVHQAGVLAAQPDREEQLLGPPVKVAVAADGSFTAQATGFATRQGAAATDLFRIQTPKGEYVAVRKRTPGRAAAEVIAEMVPQAIAALDLPRAMRWETGSSVRFIRPVRWLLALLDDQPIAFEWAGLQSAPRSRGHRGLSPGSFEVAAASDFPALWEAHHVIPEAAARRERIVAAIERELGNSGRRLRADPALLEALVDLTEFPAVISGGFDAALLRRLPAEVLVTVMRDHQKYFATEDAHGALSDRFLAVINLDRDPDGLIRHGNERVLRARFNDAAFFWDSDRKLRLEDRLPLLEQVTFHVKLGNYREKSARIERLAAWLAGEWQLDVDAASRAARLAKADLTAELVKEFTELQGIMGGRYAEADGEPASVANAIYDQYLPLAANGAAPRSPLAAAVAVADKLDSIACLFALGEAPTGSADPFALRRQANGIVRTLLIHELALNLPQAWDRALAHVPAGEPRDEVRAALATFMRERQGFYLREVEGIAYDTVNAVLAAGCDEPLDALRRARALDQARRNNSAQFDQVAAGLKRMRNIVRKEGGREKWQDQAIEPARFEKAEAALALAVRQVPEDVSAAGYDRQLEAIAALWAPLDRFFTEIRVNAEDPALRANRLALLAWALARLSRLADFAEIGGN